MLRLLVNNKILISILILVVAAAVYYFMWGAQSVSPRVDPETQRLGDQVYASLQIYNAMTLSKNLLDNPAFTSLEDFTPTISRGLVGRDDPFAPAN